MILVDGYNGGVAHITADQIRDHNIAMYGTGDYVLPVGDKFAYEIVNNNTINLSSGMVVMNGARAVTGYGKTETLTIENGTSGYKRADIIVAEYSKDNETLVESVTVKVVKGTLGSDYSDPELVTGDIRAGATKRQMALYRVKVNGLSIEAVEKMWTGAVATLGANIVPISKGGTGATTAAAAAKALGVGDYCFIKLSGDTGTWSTAGGKVENLSIASQQGKYFTDNKNSTFKVNKACKIKTSGTIQLAPAVSGTAVALEVDLRKGRTDVSYCKVMIDSTGGRSTEAFGTDIVTLAAGDVLSFFAKATAANIVRLGGSTRFLFEVIPA